MNTLHTSLVLPKSHISLHKMDKSFDSELKDLYKQRDEELARKQKLKKALEEAQKDLDELTNYFNNNIKNSQNGH